MNLFCLFLYFLGVIYIMHIYNCKENTFVRMSNADESHPDNA